MHPSSIAGPSALPAGSHVYTPRRAHSTARRGPLDVPLSPPFFDYVVDRLVDTVTASLDPNWRLEQAQALKQPRLRWWVQEVITKSRCRTSTILVALGYLDRAASCMRISLGGYACERALIGALVLANKYTNDEVYSTKAWAHAAGLTSARDVVKAERELLQVLRFDLKINGRAVASHFKAIVALSARPAIRIATHVHAPPSLHASPVASSPQVARYHPYHTPSIHALRRSSVDSAVSSGSASPLDSPELQTPEPHPFNVPAHAAFDAKRAFPAVPYVAPYILGGDSRDAFAQQFASAPAPDEPWPYLLAGGKDFGDVIPPSQPSLLAELLGDLDPQFIPVSHPPEVAPSFLTNFHPNAAHQWSDPSLQYKENALPWVEHSAQNTVPYMF